MENYLTKKDLRKRGWPNKFINSLRPDAIERNGLFTKQYYKVERIERLEKLKKINYKDDSYKNLKKIKKSTLKYAKQYVKELSIRVPHFSRWQLAEVSCAGKTTDFANEVVVNRNMVDYLYSVMVDYDTKFNKSTKAISSKFVEIQKDIQVLIFQAIYEKYPWLKQECLKRIDSL